jgi:hypothetical protein
METWIYTTQIVQETIRMKDFIAEKITIVLDTRYLELYAHLFQVPWACENIITLSSESTAMAFKAYDYY